MTSSAHIDLQKYDVSGTSNEVVYMEDYDDEDDSVTSSGLLDERGSETSMSEQSEILERQTNAKHDLDNNNNDLNPAQSQQQQQPQERHLYQRPMNDASYRGSDSTFDVEFQSIIKHNVQAVIRWDEPCADVSKSRASQAQGHVMYTVRYFPQSSPELYAEKNSVLNFVLLDNLRPNEKYIYKVRRVVTESGAHASREEAEGDAEREERWSHEGYLDTSYPDR